MIATLLLATAFGLARALHGGAYVGRIVSVLIMAFSYAAYCLAMGGGWLHAGISGLIAFALLFGGLLLGWGKGFAAITGRYNPAEKEFWPADKAGDWYFAKTGDAYDAGIVFLTVRAALFYPLFIGLAIYNQDFGGFLLSGVLVFTMGVIYWLAGKAVGEAKAVRVAEFAYFAVIGAALS